MSKIFLCCSRRSLASAKALAHNLELGGHEVWFDQAMTGGEPWWAAILQHIREAAVFVPVLTAEAMESEICRRELEYAQRLNRPILPLKVSPTTNVQRLIPPLDECQVFDYSPQDPQAPFALMGAIARLAPLAGSLPEPLPKPPAVPESHRGSLLARLEDPWPLDADAQQALILELEQRAREGRQAGELQESARRLRRRQELLAPLAGRLDTLLGGTSAGADPRSATPAPVGDAVVAGPRDTNVATDPADTHEVVQDTVRQLLRGGSRWRIAAAPLDYIMLWTKWENGHQTLCAKATMRDNTGDAKAKALKARGWGISTYSTAKALLAGGTLYATSGLAALALLSRTVRDELMTNKATRTWTITDPAASLGNVVDELQFALGVMAPTAEQVIASPIGKSSAVHGLEA